RICQGRRHGFRRLRQRAWHALEALLDAGRGWRGEEAQHRGRAGQVRHLRRPGAARADLMAESHKRLQSLLWLAFCVTAIVSQTPWWFPSLLAKLPDPVLVSLILLPVQILLAGIIIY